MVRITREAGFAFAYSSVIDGIADAVGSARVGGRTSVNALVVDARFLRSAIRSVDALEQVAFSLWIAGGLERATTNRCVVLSDAIGAFTAGTS